MNRFNLRKAPPAVAAGCSNPDFEHAAIAALAERNKAIGNAYVGDYAAAKAAAFAGWRTVTRVRVPCNVQLREVRKHLLRNLGILWLLYGAMAVGDITDGVALLVAASKEAGLANAAVSLLEPRAA
jgi:hypothetical protein